LKGPRGQNGVIKSSKTRAGKKSGTDGSGAVHDRAKRRGKPR